MPHDSGAVGDLPSKPVPSGVGYMGSAIHYLTVDTPYGPRELAYVVPCWIATDDASGEVTPDSATATDHEDGA